MKRWSIAIGITLFTVALVFGFVWRTPAPTSRPVDEILAYELLPGGLVRVKIPGALDEVLLTVWCDVGREATFDPIRRYPFALRVTLRDRDGNDVITRTYESETRVGVPTASYRASDYRVRLADSDDWIAEPRTLSVLTGNKIAQGGTMVIEYMSGAPTRVLLRAAFREPRAELEREAYIKGMTDDEKRQLVLDRSQLGVADLRPETLRRATSTWGRRLEAEGHAGTDFSVRRLFIGEFRSVFVRPSNVADVLVSKHHFAALNFLGPTKVRIRSPDADELALDGVPTAIHPVEVDPRGERTFEIVDDQDRPHTLVLKGTSETDAHLRFFLTDSDARKQIGEVVSFPGGSTTEIVTDARIFRHAILAPDDPVVLRFPKGQDVVRLVFRARFSGSPPPETMNGHATLRWFVGPSSARFERKVDLAFVRSSFDRWKDGADASEAARYFLQLPPDTRRLEVTGDPSVLVVFYTMDPFIDTDELKPPYRVTLAEDETWLHAPFDLRHWAPIASENAGALDKAARLIDLVGQVRIQKRSPLTPPGTRPELAAEPVGRPVERHFLEPAHLGPGISLPPDAWTRFASGDALRIEDKGVRARSLDVTFLAESSALGKEIRLLADGRLVAKETAYVRAGRLRGSVDAGTHRIVVEGLDEKTPLFANAAPARGGLIFRRRVVYELARDRELIFRFPAPEGMPLTVVPFVVTDGLKDPWSLRYTLQGGAARTGTFFRILTAPSGKLSGTTGELGGGLLWEGDANLNTTEQMRHGLGKAKIHVGDDRTGGLREIRLHVDVPERLWVRLVVVGEAGDTSGGEPRVWISDD